MSKVQIEVITYKKERLDYFTDLMKKAQKKYNRLFKKFKDAPILSAYHEVMCNAGREAHFHADVVEMLEKGYRDQSEVAREIFERLYTHIKYDGHTLSVWKSDLICIAKEYDIDLEHYDQLKKKYTEGE